MNRINFLDCTLRDGGYINNWRFGNLTIRSIISRLDAAGLDYIEVGFLDSRIEYDNEKSIFPDIPSIAKTLGKTRPKKSRLVAMIDYGTFDEELLIPVDESCLFGIRLIFTKERSEKALEYAKKIKAKGYNLFLNLVSTSSYSDKELLQLIDKINEIKPFGVSIVDTYGLMFGSDMAGYSILLDNNLDKDIILGYHSHNNLQMSNANTIEFIKLNQMRNIIVDSSVLGMGKNAGNACTELMVSYADNAKIRDFDVPQVLECAYTDIRKFQGGANWGYKLDFLISAILRCSPNWTKTYLKKNALSIKDICNILSALPNDKKYLPSFFSNELAEKLYEDYMSKTVNDSSDREELKKELYGQKILLICPGASIKSHKEEIEEYIKDVSPIIISLNFIASDFNVNYAFISNALRYSQVSGIYAEADNKPKILVTSNITPSPSLPGDMTFNFKTLYDNVNGDVSGALILELLLSLGINDIAFAGFDGFENGENSFFDSGYTITFENSSNKKISDELICVKERHDCSNVKFITPSIFSKIFE